MAFAAANATESRSFSVGPLKIQIMTFSAASADTSGTATFSALQSVEYVIVAGVTQTAAPTFSGNVATLAFVDPAATVYGQIIGFGK